ncbi:MAG: NRDE family protein [Alphaproteobacteria bacterium]|nr:NRDE family protein [Alphaproteobacteria bacterium]
MCTVTIIKNESSLDLFMNRDESHERAQEVAPAHHWKDDILAPLDPQSNGTWIAVNTKTKNWGVLLNGYTDAPPPPNPKSRGQILPDLLCYDDPLSALHKMECVQFMSFKLILNGTLFYWDGISLTKEQDEVFFQTSSSYKQDDVIKIRSAQFETWCNEGRPLNKEGTPTLHESIAPDKTKSIMMYRDYSCTKSITHLHIGQNDIPTMCHWLQPTNKL